MYKHCQYFRWQSNESRLLWIQGKAGSGKSTLLKQIKKALLEKYKTMEPEKLLDTGAQSIQNSTSPQARHETIVASFFYSARGGVSETSH